MIKIKKWIGNPCEACSHVLSDETGEAVFIDPAPFYPNERRHLLEYIDEEHLHPIRLLLTHAHHDHIYANDLIYNHYGLLPEVHEDDRELMTDHLHKRIDEIYKKYPYYPLPMPEHYLTDGEVIRFGNHELHVIHTPGHTPGSVFFYCEQECVAFSGDTLFYKSIGRSDLVGGNEEKLFTSLKYISEVLPDDTVLYPGHGKKTTLGFEKENNHYLLSILS